MKTSWKKILFLIVNMSVLFFPILAYADALPDGFLIGDSSGFKAKTDGKYYIDITNIKPGATYTKKIIISNYAQEKDPIALQLILGPEDKDKTPVIQGQLNLLQEVSVKLSIRGKVVYEGLMEGSGQSNQREKTKPIQLGAFKTGEVVNLLAEFSVSDKQPIEKWETLSSVDFYWLFYGNPDPTVTGKPQKPKNPSIPGIPPSLAKFLPKTGEEWRMVLVGVLVGLLIVLMVIRLFRMRRKTNKI